MTKSKLIKTIEAEKKVIKKNEIIAKPVSITDLSIKYILDTNEPNFSKLEKLHSLLKISQGVNFIKVNKAIEKLGNKEIKVIMRNIKK